MIQKHAPRTRARATCRWPTGTAARACQLWRLIELARSLHSNSAGLCTLWILLANHTDVESADADQLRLVGARLTSRKLAVRAAHSLTVRPLSCAAAARARDAAARAVYARAPAVALFGGGRKRSPAVPFPNGTPGPDGIDTYDCASASDSFASSSAP